MIEKVPEARITAAEVNTDSPAHAVVTVECPYCGRGHRHGTGLWDADHGHRVAHCHPRTANDGYLITDPDDLVGSLLRSGGVGQSARHDTHRGCTEQEAHMPP